MSYIYKLTDDIEFKYASVEYRYFPVKKKTGLMFRPISFYKKIGNEEGICAMGNIIEGAALKSSKISLPLPKGIEIYNRSYFQVKVELVSYSPRGLLIENRILKQFPSYNSKTFKKPLNPYTVYFDAGLSNSIFHVWQYFHYGFSGDITKRLWKYYIHLLRESRAKYRWKYKLPMQHKKCNSCGFKSEIPFFLEIHDTAEIDFEKEYIPIAENNFIVLCPNCHKLAHQDIKRCV